MKKNYIHTKKERHELKKRKGILKLDEDIINEELSDNGVILMRLFAEFIPVDLNYNHLTRKLTYHGYSHMFREIEEGQRIPEYICKVTRTKNKFGDKYTVVFEEYK